MIPALTPRALRTRWSVQALARCAADAARSDAGRRAVPGAALARGPVEAMGLRFPSPVLVAAGFDRRGRLLADAAALGLGGVETGSHRPSGAGHAPMLRIAAARPHGWGGGADGRSRPCHGLSLLVPNAGHGTPARRAAVLCAALAGWQAHADYAVLNPGRSGATPAECVALLAALAELRDRLPRARRLALVAKLPAAWVGRAEAGAWARRLVEAGADGLLVSAEAAPQRAGEDLARLVDAVGAQACLISVGGIDSVREAAARLAAGARLLQIHRALLGAPDAARALLAGVAALGSRGRRCARPVPAPLLTPPPPAARAAPAPRR